MGLILRLLFLVGGMGLIEACSGTHESHSDPSGPAAAALGRTVPQLNIPDLLKLSIDDVSQRVGPRLPVPAGTTDPLVLSLAQRGVPMDSTTFFRSRGLSMVAAYDDRTRRVSELLLLGTDESDLMHRGQLALGAARYLVLPVFQFRHPTKLMGLRVLATTLIDKPAANRQ